MSTLFPLEPVLPAGFTYEAGFISESEEAALLEAMASVELHPFIFQGYTAHRKVASFGYDYSFTSKRLSRGKDIPAVFNPLMEKVAARLSRPSDDFAELLVMEYPPGAAINWHRDAPPFGIIAGISLASDCRFRLRPHEKEKQSRSSIISFTVERRSLYVMEGPARSEWQHSTAPVKATRYSITLRTLKESQ